MLHVPLLIRYPSRFDAGERVDTVVRLEDVFPTILSLVGQEVPAGLDARSLLAPVEERIARAAIGEVRVDASDYPEFVRSQLWRPQCSVYDGRYHLIQRKDGWEELYDVEADPLETRNLAPGMPAILDRLRRILPPAPGIK